MGKSNTDDEIRNVELLRNSINHLKESNTQLAVIAKAAKERKEKALLSAQKNVHAQSSDLDKLDTAQDSQSTTLPLIKSKDQLPADASFTKSIKSLRDAPLKNTPPSLSSGSKVAKDEFKGLTSK